MNRWEFFRKDRLPTIFCPGCGNGMVMNCLYEALSELDVDMDRLVVVSGIGCSSRIPSYLLVDSLHTTHGRAIPVATGIKLARPDLHVLVITGDGDVGGIGGNHLIHACRRNVELLTICINNFIYGMTGGQTSPTTPLGCYTTTAPYGSVEQPFDLSRLAAAAGANYVARWTAAHPLQLVGSIKHAWEKEGFSFIEVLSPCPTAFGRRNDLRIRDMFRWLRFNTGRKEEAGKVLIGEIADRSAPSLGRALGLLHGDEDEAEGGNRQRAKGEEEKRGEGEIEGETIEGEEEREEER